MIAVIDLGNTRAKVKFGEEIFAFAYDERWLEQLKKIFSHEKEILFGVSSVNSARETELKKFFSGFPQIKIISIKEIFPPKNEILDYSNISGVGIDRLLGVVGARKNSSEDIITIDCGTAITINAAKEKFFLGGVIFAGMKTQLDALKEKSPILHIEKIPEENFPFIGENTQDALIAGVVRGVAGAVEKICSEIEEKFFSHETVRKVISGGDGKKIFSLVEKKNFFYDENMVLKGAEKIVRENFPAETE